MGHRRHPPTRGFRTFDLFRDAFEDEVTLRLFEGDTYELSQAELAVWLREVGCERASKTLDLCWNFRHVHYDLTEQRHVCPKNEDYAGPDPKYRPLAPSGAGNEDLIIQAALGAPVPFNVQHYEGPFDAPQLPGGF